MFLIIWAICDDIFLSLRTKITLIPDIQNSLISLIINPKSSFYYDVLFVSLNHILIQKIHLHGYLMIKWRIIFMYRFVIIIHRYVIICIERMNWCEIRFFLFIDYIVSIIVTCMINYFCWIWMIFHFFTCIVVIKKLSLILVLGCVLVFLHSK